MKKQAINYSPMAGFSIIEIILATAIFAIFSTGVVGLVLQGLEANRLGAEETIATQYASQGLEAARSIKNQAFTNLVTTNATGIIRTPQNVWGFSGTNNTFNKYTRTIKIDPVQRDSNGNIIASGGTIDANAKKITSAVNWNFSPGRINAVSLSTYLSDWKKPLSSQRGGMLVYGTGSTTTNAVSYQLFDATTSTWNSPASATISISAANQVLRAMRIYASATRNEKIMISRHYDGSNQYIYAQVFNGASWGNAIQLSNWTANILLDARNFDGTYLANGDFMVVYSDNTTIPKFRVWNGASWNPASGNNGIATQNIGGIPSSLVIRQRPNTNEIMAAFFDQAKVTSTQYFDGASYQSSNWTLHPQHANNATNNTNEFVVFAWDAFNPLKGALVYTDAASDRDSNIKIFTANGSGGGSWGASVESPIQGDIIQHHRITASSANDTFLICSQNLRSFALYPTCYTSDITPLWTTPTNNIFGSLTSNGAYDIAFEALSGTTALAVYHEFAPRGFKYRTYSTSSNSFTSPTVISTISISRVLLLPQPETDDIMITLEDTSKTVYTIIWNGTSNTMYTTPDGKAWTSHAANTSSINEYNFGFVWDKN